MKYSDLDIPIPFLPSMAIFQKVQILHLIYPSFIHGCNSILNMTYIDYEKLSYAVLRNVLHTNANIHQRMKVIEAELSRKKIIKGGDVSGAASTSNDASPSGDSAPSTGAAQAQGQAQPHNAPLPPPPSSYRVPGWVWFLVISVIFKYVLNSKCGVVIKCNTKVYVLT